MQTRLSYTIKRLLVSVAVFMQATAYARGPGTVSDLVAHLMGPAKGLSHTLDAVCFVAGAGFTMSSIVQYFQHRRNKAHVRLHRVFFLLICGLLLLAVPYIAHFSPGHV